MRKLSCSIQGFVAALLGLGLLFVLAGTASAHSTLPAHAKVLSAIPAIGSMIRSAPTKVTVTTAENMKPGPTVSNLFVYAPNGDLISQGNATIALNNPKMMSVPIKANGNGIYVVRWITVSADDGDPDQGAFVFTVNPTAAATPTATGNGTTTTNSSSGTGGAPIWVPILVGILALLVGLGAGFGFGRNRNRAKPAPVSAMRRTVAAQQKEDEVSAKKP